MVATTHKYRHSFIHIAAVIVGFLVSQSAFADINTGWTNISSLMETFAHNYPPIRAAVTGFAFIAGIMLIVKAIFRLRAYGQVRTMMPSHAEFAGPMIQFCLGVLLMFLPSLIQVSIASFWGYSNPIGYSESGATFGSIGQSIGGIIQILGLIALVRGMMIMARSAQKGAQPGQFGKGITHLIGGVCAVNYWGIIASIKASFGV